MNHYVLTANGRYVCAELGGTLAHLETKEESDFLEEIVYNEAYIGCLNDGITRLFDGDFYYSKVMTNKMCIQKCRQHYFKFAGTQYFGQCFCGNATWKKFQKHGQSPEGECKLPCYGNKGESCGGHWKLSVYLTGGWKHWVGGTDMLEEGEWIWFPGNTPLTYTDWLSTEPDNQLHSSLEKEHCMSLSPSVYGSYKWSDEICSKHLFFICERNAIKTRHR
ncbi:C-type lectin mannose-binding isoform-like [Saccostrea echinata]|uniref:C-type lectin mannose-binding isoform-like n=1 Tax=Saccostrea echinata TaxID=191078 RepID=UPI002A7FD90D|nr:C-type lectin mannose-binding isoform-like [Saccostrea echinata]